MVHYKLILFILFIVLLFGCAGHSTFALKSLSSSERIQTHKDGIVIFARPFLNKDELCNYFADDLIENGILPIQIHILNESDSDIGIITDKFSLLPPTGDAINIATIDDVYQSAKTSYAATPILTLAFLHVGLFGSAGNITDANIKLNADLQSKILKPGLLQKHKFIDGVMFFSMKKNIRNLDGWILSCRVYSQKEKKDCDIKVSL